MTQSLTSIILSALGVFVVFLPIFYLALRILIIVPQRRLMDDFVRHLRAKRRKAVEQELRSLMKSGEVIDNAEWAIVASKLLEYGQRWAMTNSEPPKKLRPMIARLAEDASSREHRLSRDIVTRVLASSAR